MPPRLLISFLLLLPSASGLLAQNLIPNPSFEKIKKHKWYFGRINSTYDWFSPTDGTPDLFTPVTMADYAQPKNKFGMQDPYEGKVYAGICNEAYASIYEYLSTKLLKPLVKDSFYKLSFYCSLGDEYLYTQNGLDISFTNEKNTLYKNGYCKLSSQNVIYDDSLVFEKKEWFKKEMCYKANGGEQYLTIGNFKEYSKTKIQHIKTSKSPQLLDKQNLTYFYLDNFSLTQVSDSSGCPCKKQLKIQPDSSLIQKDSAFNLIEGATIILQNIYFETDKSNLLAASNTELDKLVETLNDNPGLVIEISGHTDNTGSTQHNKELSEARAKAVVDYLVGKGINKLRLTYQGYGSMKPIAPNDTEDGRAKNRRVEFKVIRL